MADTKLPLVFECRRVAAPRLPAASGLLRPPTPLSHCVLHDRQHVLGNRALRVGAVAALCGADDRKNSLRRVAASLRLRWRWVGPASRLASERRLTLQRTALAGAHSQPASLVRYWDHSGASADPARIEVEVLGTSSPAEIAR